MLERCTNARHKSYARYGGRGIAVCDRWQTFENFFADMGEKPAGATIDRIDNDGNYEPGNVRWATTREQANNRGSNVRVTYRGREFTLAELARETGVSEELIRDRRRRNWSVEDTISTPKGTKGIKAR
jgi:hypothetical protein